MSSYTERLDKRGFISPPSFIRSNIHYECIMGSVAYGISSDNSDLDLYGWCIPPKSSLFPHLNGEIFGFDLQQKRFENYIKHHIKDETANGGKGQEYDIAIYNITKYFRLCLDNNPNMVDSLFVPTDCITHISQIGQMVRESRHKFLHKGCFKPYKGYCYSQLHKMQTKDPSGKRKEIQDKYGFDVKFALHVVRLLDELEQILSKEDLDLRKNREHLKAIRRGDVSEKEIRNWFSAKEQDLEKLKINSKLPERPRTEEVKQLLLNCLEEHFGSLEDAITQRDRPRKVVDEIKQTLRRFGKLR